MAGNKVQLTFAGDADSLAAAGKKAESSLAGVDKAADKSGNELKNASGSSADLSTKMGHLGSATSGAMDAFSSASDALNAYNDYQQAAAEKAAKLARAQADVAQAQEDINQAMRDGAQATIDADQAVIDQEQALLDVSTAQDELNKAIKEHGKNSTEAKQAQLDLNQASLDYDQALEDSEQATRDSAQALIDAQSAQLDLNEAQTEANRIMNPTLIQQWSDKLNLITPILSAVVGIIGLVTAAQWLWNASLFASPVTWIVLAIVALIAIIVIIATKTTWFQDIWNAAWGGIKDAAQWAWDGIVAGAKFLWDYLGSVWSYLTSLPGKLKSAFASVTDFITAPFRAAFNFVARAWNSTIGQLHWTVPGWVPGVGGNSISAPKLPTFHQGGIVSGALGAEVLGVLQAGERVTPGGGHAEETVTLESSGSEWDNMILASVRRSVGLGGNDPVRVLRSSRG